jgi:thioredoxin 2
MGKRKREGRAGKLDSDSLVVACRKCGVKNRIPLARQGDKAWCGKCHVDMILKGLDQPVAANDTTFTAEVIQSGFPVLVDFWAPWCGPCRTMSPVLERLSRKYAGRLKIVKVNVDENPAVASQYGIRSIPSLFFFKKGAVINSLLGALPQQELERQIGLFIGG